MAAKNNNNKTTVHVDRSSKTGRFVTDDYARRHPSTTEHQTIKKNK